MSALDDVHRAAAARLVRLRLAAGYRTAVDAAAQIGANKTTYLQHESGVRPLTIRAALVYAAFYDVRPGWLLFGETRPVIDPTFGEYRVIVIGDERQAFAWQQ
jgi:hypothetical protein